MACALPTLDCRGQGGRGPEPSGLGGRGWSVVEPGAGGHGELQVVQKSKQACCREGGLSGGVGVPAPSPPPAFLRALPGGLDSACGAGRSGGGGPTRRPGRLRAAPTGLLVLGRPRALAWASDTQCARGASPRPRGLGQWAFQQLEEAGGPREGRLRQAGERGGKGRGQTFGFYKVKEI